MPSKPNACPCSRETAEQLEAGSEPDRVVTLVHGTFARHAGWMREGPLWEGLQPSPADPAALPGRTLFSRFCWTGKNSHTGRLRAAEDLRKHLRDLTDKFPNARHFVIGHSHGGNVILYATKDEELADRMTGAVTLATPFLTVHRRRLHPLVLFGILSVCLFGALEALLYFKLDDAVKHPASFSIAFLLLLWLSATVLSALKYRGREFGLGRLLRLLLRRKGAEEIVTRELERLQLTPEKEGVRSKQLEKLLVARPFGDEASMTLVVSQFLSWLQNRILTVLSVTVRGWRSVAGFHRVSVDSKGNPVPSEGSDSGTVVSSIKSLVILAVPLFVSVQALPITSRLLWELTGDESGRLIQLLFPLVFAAYGVMCLIGLLVLLAAGFAFGWDAMFWSHFASTTAESSPPGPARVFLQSPPPPDPATGSRDLAHSGIYTDPKVIREIVDWIRLREQQ